MTSESPVTLADVIEICEVIVKNIDESSPQIGNILQCVESLYNSLKNDSDNVRSPVQKALDDLVPLVEALPYEYCVEQAGLIAGMDKFRKFVAEDSTTSFLVSDAGKRLNTDYLEYNRYGGDEYERIIRFMTEYKSSFPNYNIMDKLTVILVDVLLLEYACAKLGVTVEQFREYQSTTQKEAVNIDYKYSPDGKEEDMLYVFN